MTDAMAGKGALFIRQDTVEAAWAVVDPVLADHPAALRYPLRQLGPAGSGPLAAAHGGWRNPEIR